MYTYLSESIIEEKPVQYDGERAQEKDRESTPIEKTCLRQNEVISNLKDAVGQLEKKLGSVLADSAPVEASEKKAEDGPGIRGHNSALYNTIEKSTNTLHVLTIRLRQLTDRLEV